MEEDEKTFREEDVREQCRQDALGEDEDHDLDEQKVTKYLEHIGIIIKRITKYDE